MPTIINLRGTSGSGKSTVVRRIMACYTMPPIYATDRRRPLSYRSTTCPALFVPGHYETACGGCDTIKTPDQVYNMVRAAVEQGDNILYEGIIVQDDTKRLIELNKEHPVTVIELSTPIEQCLEGVQSRRYDRGDTRPLNPKNTVDRKLRVHKTCEKLRGMGLSVPYLNREEAYLHCLRAFGIEMAANSNTLTMALEVGGSNPSGV